MFDFNNYVENKKVLITRLEKIKEKMMELNDMEIDSTEAVQKLENVIQMIKNEKVSVVLVGAFSDGKTSVAAGWLNEKVDNMKIASDESSDEIIFYKPESFPDNCYIVDTPGLFGDKKGSDDNGGIMALSDITKKYISEANLIIYVVTAKNPIKDSHKESIKWILKDLNKMDVTLFVINRMDDVADLTDDDDFNRQKKIKIDNLREKLLACGLDEIETRKTKVVCISASPDGKDIESWKNHREEYLKRSHIKDLDDITKDILEKTKDEILTKTACDVINDEVYNKIELINEKQCHIKDIIIPQLRDDLKCNKKDLDNMYKRIIRSKREMKDDLKKLQKKKISILRTTTMDKYNDFLEDEIGVGKDNVGNVLIDEINDICMEYVQKHAEWLTVLDNKIRLGYEKQHKAINDLLMKGAHGATWGMKGAGKIGINAYKNGIFAGREALGKLGVVIKFKPWQVTKMASFASKAVPVLGAVIDVGANVFENLSEEKENKKFEENKEQVKEFINNIFDEVFSRINDDKKYLEDYAPNYTELKQSMEAEEERIKYFEVLIDKYDNWKKEIKKVE